MTLKSSSHLCYCVSTTPCRLQLAPVSLYKRSHYAASILLHDTKTRRQKPSSDAPPGCRVRDGGSKPNDDPLARYLCTPPSPTPARGHTKQPHTRAEAQPYTAMTYNMPMASAPTRHSVGLRQWMQPSTSYVGNSERAHPGLSRRAAAHGAGPDSMNIGIPPDALLSTFPWFTVAVLGDRLSHRDANSIG